MLTNVKLLTSVFILISLIGISSAGITFDSMVSGSLYRVNATSGGATLNTSTTQINFDIFRDNVAVGDYVAWGYQHSVWHNLKLNVSVPVSATSFQVVWQYSNSSGTLGNWSNFTSAENLTDNTKNFTVAGVNDVTWNIPDYFDLMPDLGSSSGDCFWIRALVINVTSPVEGGRIGNNATNWKDYAIKLISGSYTPQDIYNADVSGAWNITEHIGSYYLIKSNLVISTNANISVTNTTMLEMGYPTINYNDRYKKRTIRHTSSSNYIKIGEMDYITNDTYSGSVFKYNNPYFYASYGSYNGVSNINLWNSIFYMEQKGFSDFRLSNFDFRNSVIENSVPLLLGSSGKNTLHNIIVSGSTSVGYAYLYASNVSINNIILKNVKGLLTGVTTTLTNINFGNNKNLSVANSGFNTTCVDCFMYNYSAQLSTLGTNNGFYANYTLIIDIYNKTGDKLYDVNATIINSEGTTVFNGLWTNTTMINTYYKKYPAVIYDYNPFTIVLSRNGMVDYRTNITINNLNKYLSITMGDYPFEVNGTMVISQGKGIRIFK